MKSGQKSKVWLSDGKLFKKIFYGKGVSALRKLSAFVQMSNLSFLEIRPKLRPSTHSKTAWKSWTWKRRLSPLERELIYAMRLSALFFFRTIFMASHHALPSESSDRFTNTIASDPIAWMGGCVVNGRVDRLWYFTLRFFLFPCMIISNMCWFQKFT